MATQILRDRTGRKIGEIVEQSGVLIIRDYIGRKRGSYDPKSNITRDWIGKVIGTGNLLTSLL
jgi:hypothetical protein